jgi:hypothetical protein
MARRSPIRWPIWGAVAPLVLLLAGPLPAASASCGDYVHILPAGAAPDDAPARPKAPCHGPGCQDAPGHPPTPTPPPTSAPPHDAVLVALVSFEAPRGKWSAPATPSLPRRIPPPVFHPPRG